MLASAQAASDGAFAFVSFPFSNGEHSISAVARDAAANTSPQSSAVRFFVDALPPVIRITTAAADGPAFTVNGGPISGTAEDNTAIVGVHLDYYDVTGRLALSEDARTCTGCGSDRVTWTDRPSFALPGYYTVQAVAYDKVGNTSTPDSRTFVVTPV